ncbi:MAG: hypothetical protein IT580_02025 [Verrucomicrobiales bacterium]|nr:hypothetical protein [Verrucomicrobiales bacterium]
MEAPFLRDEHDIQGEQNRVAEAALELFESLHDPEFDEALYEMVATAGAAAEEASTALPLKSEDAEAELERVVSQQYAPVVAEAHRMYDRLSEGLESVDLNETSVQELERVMDGFAPEASALPPEQQQFVGALFRKAKQAVRGAVSLARKGIQAVGKGLSAVARLALKPLWSKLKSLLMPLLKRAAMAALGKPSIATATLARNNGRRVVGGERENFETESGEGLSGEQPESIQREYDSYLLETVFGEGRSDAQMMVNEWSSALSSNTDPIRRLDEARDQLAERLAKLEDGEDPQPAIQEFIPVALMAIKPVLSAVVRLIGRERIVRFLAGFLAKMISGMVGPQRAAQVSRHVVSTALRGFGFETETDPRRAAAEVLAQTIQETLLSLAEQPESLFENPTLIQVAAQEAFESAAAANFPPEALRPDLRESETESDRWVAHPVQRRRKYFKKYSRVFEIQLTRRLAESVRTFDGMTLAEHLDATRVMRWNVPLRVRVHLYEIAPVARLADITVRERQVEGLGSARWEAWSQLHPLGVAAATALLREPGLGRDVDAKYTENRYSITRSQRFYYLEMAVPTKPRPVVPRRTPPPVPQVGITNPTGGGNAPSGVPAGARASARCAGNRVGLIIDIPRRQVVVKIRLAEEQAQQIANALRRQDITGAVHVFRSVRSVLRGLLTGGTSAGLTVRWPGSASEMLFEQLAPATAALAAVGQGAIKLFLEKIGEKLFDLVWAALERDLRARASEFITMAEDPADGVTVFLTFNNLGALSVVVDMVRGNPRAILGLVTSGIPYPGLFTVRGCTS